LDELGRIVLRLGKCVKCYLTPLAIGVACLVDFYLTPLAIMALLMRQHDHTKAGVDHKIVLNDDFSPQQYLHDKTRDEDADDHADYHAGHRTRTFRAIVHDKRLPDLWWLCWIPLTGGEAMRGQRYVV